LWIDELHAGKTILFSIIDAINALKMLDFGVDPSSSPTSYPRKNIILEWSHRGLVSITIRLKQVSDAWIPVYTGMTTRNHTNCYASNMAGAI
jgi:hypothetical protein